MYFKPWARREKTGGTGDSVFLFDIETFSGTYDGRQVFGNTDILLFANVFKMKAETGEFEQFDDFQAIELFDITQDAINPDNFGDERVRIMRISVWNEIQDELNNNGGAGVMGNTGGTYGGRRKLRRKSAKKARGSTKKREK